MSQLNPKQYARIAQIIDELADVDISGTPGKFIADQVERKRQYGERIFLSPKQIQWLEDLHEEHVGNTDFDQERDDDAPDDDIQF